MKMKGSKEIERERESGEQIQSNIKYVVGKRLLAKYSRCSYLYIVFFLLVKADRIRESQIQHLFRIFRINIIRAVNSIPSFCCRLILVCLSGLVFVCVCYFIYSHYI